LKIELINTGAELLLGRVLNTHQQWLCRRLTDLGYEVSRQVCVLDDAHQIQAAVRESLERADLVLTTGGLGPTSDDVTRDGIAELLGRKLLLDSTTLSHIQSYFASRRRTMPASTRVQAMVPQGARVLPNPNGTAPGLAMEVNPNPYRKSALEGGASPAKSWLVMLPGPPRELQPMFGASVVPLLQQELPLPAKFICRTFKTTGLGESLVEEKIRVPLQALVQSGLQLGYCARIGEVDVRLAARGPEAAPMIEAGERILRDCIGTIIFGTEDDSIEAVLIRLLSERKKTLALAESCTGGLIAHRLTNVPGASAVLMSGLVAYSNEAKRDLLGVRAESLQQAGAVSQIVAREMAEGARRRCKVDYALGVTGIAGPTGGAADKPVGTVFIALAAEGGTTVQPQFNPFDRETFKFVTSQQSLDLLRRAVLEPGG
jgi:nicotinamide-nucleotide amidase